MTLRYLLDTCVVSSPISRQPNPGIVTRLEAQSEHCAIASPVWQELTYGLLRLPAGRRRDTLERYLHDVVLASFPILPYDAAAARRHATLRARLEAAGRPAPYVDSEIAAIALVHGLTLVTVNTRDFAAMEDLTVEDWSAQ